MDTIDLLRSLTEGVNSKVNMDFLAQNDDTEELEYVVKTSLTKKEKTVVETDGHKLEEEEEVVVSPPKSYKPKIDRQGNPFKRGPRGPRKKKIPVVEEPIVEELYIESGVEGDILPDSLEEIFDADFVSEGIIDEPVLELKELSFEEEEVVLDEPKDVIDLEDISEEYDELFSSVKPVKFDSKFDFDSEEIDFDKEFGLDDDTDLGKEFEDDFESEDVIDEKSDVVEFEETDSSLEKEFEDIEDFDFDKTDESSDLETEFEDIADSIFDKTDESSDLEAEFESLEDSDFSGFEKDTDIDESSDDFETDDVLDLEDEKEDEAELFETLSNNDIIIDENYALSQIEFEEDLDFDYNAILSKKKLEEQREKSIEEKIVEEKPIEKEIKVEQKMEESIKESKKKSSKKEVEVEVLERVEDKSEARALNKSIEEESIEAVEEVVETIDKTEETEETEDDAFKNCVFYKGMDIEEYLKQNPKYRESFYVEHFYTKEYLNQMLMSGLILMKKGKYFL